MKNQFFKLLGKSILTGLILVLMGLQYTYAQQTVTGTVTDENNEGIPGVNILVEGTTNGTQTDFDGKYSISSTPEDVLVISYLGYATQKIIVGDQTTINVKLRTDQQQLDEVVVIGYGTVSKKDLTGSVSQVSSKSFEEQPLTRVEDALQGRASGVAVSRTDGTPGAAVKVRIRGVNSITGNNDPLVVVDGIIGGDLTNINPDDIAAMDILKDASATAIYGSRGSNGVILITTKKGSGKGKISVNYFTTISSVPKLIPLMSVVDFAEIENIRRVRTGGSPIFTDAEISALAASGGVSYQDEVLRTAFSNNIELSASGSEGNISYLFSGSYTDQEGTLINTDFNRLSLRSNVSAQVTDRLKVGLNIFGSRSELHNNLNASTSGRGSTIFQALTWDPTTPVRNSDGEYNFRSVRSIASLSDNPVFVLEETDLNNINDRIDANLNLNYDITSNLDYTLIAGTSIFNLNVENYNVETGDDRLPDSFFGGTKNTLYQISNILTWQKNFGDHSLKLTGVQEFSNTKNRFNSYRADGSILPRGFYLAELAPNSGQSISNNFTEGEIVSFMFRGEYILASDLFLTGTVRVDKSSVFRANNRTGTFPSVALAYNLNRLMGDSSVFSTFKVRAGWGEVGNQNIPALSTFATLGTNSFAFDGSSASTGSFLEGFSNEDLKWETTAQTNVGIDLGFLNGRAKVTIDGYKKNTRDLLLNVPISDTNGGGSILQNVGEVENVGVDLSLSYDVLDTEDLNWNTNLSFSYSKNEVINLFNGLEEIAGTFNAPGGQSRAVNVIQLGQPLGQFFGATFLGTWKTAEATEAATFGNIPGDAKYLRDADGEIVFGAIGNGTPTTFWGLNNTLTYKNWNLNVFLQGVHGFDVFNIQQAAIVGGQGNSRSFLAPDQVNQWTPTNETDIPAGSTFFNSSRFVEDGSFIRLSNLSLGYTLKDVAGLGNTSIKLYVAGQNLFLITDYTGYDPEHTSQRSDVNVDAAAGINIGANPNPRTFTIGAKIGF